MKHPRRGHVEGGSDRRKWCADTYHIAYQQAAFNVFRPKQGHAHMSKKLTPKRRKMPPVVTPDPRIQLARRLDQLADHNLHLGFHGAAEQLAQRAAQIREGAR